MKNNLVGWKSIAPIIADVVISPWNLLVGGLLISKLSLPYALISIIIGYLILGVLFYYYGGIGFKLRQNTSQIIEPVFGKKGTRIFFSMILALGQIGWFAIINQIGGESLAFLGGFPLWLGIIIYAGMMILMASLSLHNLGIVKSMITFSSIALLLYLVAANYQNIYLPKLLDFSNNQENILWGISVVVASLMSFTSVSPDFTSKIKSKKDLLITILTGLFIPGMVVATLGAILFLGKNTLSLETIIGFSTIAFFGHWFNVVTNTDAAIAIYTPGLRLRYVFGWPFTLSVIVAALFGTIFSLFNIRSQLEIWLSVIAGVYPSLVGVTIAHYCLKYFGLDSKNITTNWRAISIILASSMLIFFVNISLLNWVVGGMSFILYIAMTGVTIKIYIERQKR